MSGCNKTNESREVFVGWPPSPPACSKNHNAFIFLSSIFLSLVFHSSHSKAGHDREIGDR